jgi:hypothetical protein
MTTTPAPEPTPVTPAAPASPAPPAGANPVTRAVHWLESHVVPALKSVDAAAERVISEAQKLEAVVEAADPALASQLTASAAALREIAADLAAL